MKKACSDLLYHGQVTVVKTRAQVEDGLLGLDGRDLAVVPRVEGSEGGLVLGLVLHLLLQTYAEYHVSSSVKHNLNKERPVI